MTTTPPPKRTKNIVAHTYGSLCYSLAGGRYLLTQRAAHLHLILFGITALLFVISGVGITQWLVMLALFATLLAVEAINTAIELIIDRTSPEISDYAKNAKDLGSFAVFCAIVVFITHGLWAIGRVVLAG